MTVVVLTADRMDCGQSVSPLQLADVGSSGVVQLSSSLVPAGQTSNTGCGSDAAPWLISAHPGQHRHQSPPRPKSIGLVGAMLQVAPTGILLCH